MAQPTYEELLAKIAELEANKRTGRAPSLTLKVGLKGGVSMYGTGRFPITLYPEQWVKVLTYTTGLSVTDLLGCEMLKFISDNRDNGLTFKNGIPELNIPAAAAKA